MAGGLVLASCSALGQALTAHQIPLIIFSATMGIGYAMTQSLQMPLLAEHVTDEERPTAAALISALATLSTTAGTLLGGLLPEILGRAGFGAVTRDRVALLAAVAVGSLGVIPILRLNNVDTGPGVGNSSPIGTTQTEDLRGQIRRLVRQYALATALISAGAGAFLPFVNVYLVRLGAHPGEIGGLLSLVGAIGAALGLLAPALARGLGRERLAVAARVAPILPALLLLFLPTIPLVVLTYGARQIGAGMTWPIEASILNNRVHPRARAGAFGLRTAAWNLAWAGSSAISGQVIVRGGYNWPIIILIASTAVGGIVLSLVLRPRLGEQSPGHARGAKLADSRD